MSSHTCLLALTVICWITHCCGQNLTEKCDNDWQRYLSNRLSAQWARKMFDSTGKFESGALEGNRFFEGNYPECINVHEDESDPEAIKGLFCVGLWTSGPISVKKGMAYCIPDSCTDQDAAVLLPQVYVNVIGPDEDSTMVYCVRDPVLSDDPAAIVTITIISIFGALVAAATAFDVFYASKTYKAISTVAERGKRSNESKVGVTITPMNVQNGHVGKDGLHDLKDKHIQNDEVETSVDEIASHKGPKNSENKEHGGLIPSAGDDLTEIERSEDIIKKPGTLASMLLSFSLYTNVPRLLRAKHTPGSFSCLHGIRFLSMAGVVWGHTYAMIFGMYAPMIRNIFPALRDLYTFPSEAFFQMYLVVDTFFLMSGFLVCYSLMKAIAKHHNKVSVKMMVMYFFHRYWRLTPVYAMVLLMFVTLLHYMANGPMMPPELPEITACKDYWWRNLLYIQNLFPVESYEYCFSHAWYLAIDMQLYIAAPPFIILTYFYPFAGIPVMIAGYLGSVVSNIVVFHQLSTEGGDIHVQQYVKPWTRANTYFLGMLLGVIMFKTKGKISMNKIIVALGWVLSISFILLAMYLPYVQRAGCSPFYWPCHAWTTAGSVTWDSLVGTIYILGVAWIILACVSGHGGFVDRFLSWRAWIPLSRLSYTAYLVHISLLVIFGLGSPVQFYFSHYTWLFHFCGNMCVTMIVSFAVSLMFEVPMLGLEKVLLPHR